MVAFAILAHTQPTLLRRFIERLHPFPVTVHIDKKANIEAFRRELAPMDGVSLLPDSDRVDVRWAGFSQVVAMRRVLKDAAATVEPDDYVVLCSGADYPLRPIGELASFLAACNGTQFIKYFDVPSSSDLYRRQVERYHYQDAGPYWTQARGRPYSLLNAGLKRALRVANLPRPRKPPVAGMRVAFGSSWFALTSGCITEILAEPRPDFDHYMSTAFSSDEKYIHTLVANSRFHTSTPAGGYEPFEGRGTYRLANLHHIHPSLAKWYTLADSAELQGSDKWFVRKVRLPESASLLDLLDGGA